MDADFFSFYNPVRPKMPLGYVVYICYENSLAEGCLGSEGGKHLKLDLIAQYLAFEGHTSHFDACLAPVQ